MCYLQQLVSERLFFHLGAREAHWKIGGSVRRRLGFPNTFDVRFTISAVRVRASSHDFTRGVHLLVAQGTVGVLWPTTVVACCSCRAQNSFVASYVLVI